MKIDPRSVEERTERWIKDARNVLVIVLVAQIFTCVGIYRG